MTNHIFTVVCVDIPEDKRAEILADLPSENAKVRKIDMTPTLITNNAGKFNRLGSKLGNKVKEMLVEKTPMVASWVSTDFIRQIEFIDNHTLNIHFNPEVMDTVNMFTLGWSKKKMRKEVKKWIENDYGLKVIEVVYDGK